MPDLNFQVTGVEAIARSKDVGLFRQPGTVSFIDLTKSKLLKEAT